MPFIEAFSIVSVSYERLINPWLTGSTRDKREREREEQTLRNRRRKKRTFLLSSGRLSIRDTALCWWLQLAIHSSLEHSCSGNGNTHKKEATHTTSISHSILEYPEGMPQYTRIS